MLKKTVTYTNVDGDQVSKDLYFNISSAELVEKEALSNDTFLQRIRDISKSDKLSEVYPTIVEFFQDGYGVRTEDGEFEKGNEHWEKFRKSLAFQALMDELLLDPGTNGQKLADFINGMLPPELVAQAKEAAAQPGFRLGADTSRPTPPVAGAPTAPPIQVAPAEGIEWDIDRNQPVQPTQVPAPEEAPVTQTSEPRNPDLGEQQRYQQ